MNINAWIKTFVEEKYNIDAWTRNLWREKLKF